MQTGSTTATVLASTSTFGKSLHLALPWHTRTRTPRCNRKTIEYHGIGNCDSALTVVPFSQGSKLDVEALVDYIYAMLGMDYRISTTSPQMMVAIQGQISLETLLNCWSSNCWCWTWFFLNLYLSWSRRYPDLADTTTPIRFDTNIKNGICYTIARYNSNIPNPLTKSWDKDGGIYGAMAATHLVELLIYQFARRNFNCH